MEEKARRIISKNLFMTLASVSMDGEPWSTPVFYATDSTMKKFFWYSRKDTVHSQNIKSNTKVTASLFSLDGEDAMTGVYLKGYAHEVEETELDEAIAAYIAKAAQTDEEKELLSRKEDFLGDAPLRMYVMEVEECSISGEASKWNGKWMDTRENVNL